MSFLFPNIETPTIRINDQITDNEAPSWEAHTHEDDDIMLMQGTCHDIDDPSSEDFVPEGHGLKPPQGTYDGLNRGHQMGYTYEGDGLLPVEGTYEDLGDLLRSYEIEGVDDTFLTNKLLRHILSKDRIKAELRKSSSQLEEQKVHDYIDLILGTSKEAKVKGYLRIFAILLLIGRPGDIGSFIKSGFNDHRLPIVVRPNPITLLRKRTCFLNWRSNWLDAFLTFQWRVTTPFFDTTTNGKVLSLPLQTRKPWQISTVTRGMAKDEPVQMAGAYGTVTRVDIHPTSHAFQDLLLGINLECAKFAIKTLHNSDQRAKKEFQDEWNMLQRFNGHVHPHLVTALGAFNQGEKWSFIFPNAAHDLEEYLAIAQPPRGQDGACWVSKQILGLTGALHSIHNPEHLVTDTKRFGRHGDIKRDNILCFQGSGTTAEMILVISDFGLSAFNRDTSRSNIPNKKVPPVPGYRPPECDIEGGTISRAFDIWTLGCLFLEFITWFLGGTEYVNQFCKERETVYINGTLNDIFFSFKRSGQDGSLVAQVKPEVTEWIYKLRQNPSCSGFVHSILDMIENEMLVVLSMDQLRATSGTVLNSLKEIDKRCRDEAEFTKGKPWNSMQVDQCRDDVAVEAIPNDYTRGIIQSLQVQLPIHTGRTRKSLRAEELEKIDGN